MVLWVNEDKVGGKAISKIVATPDHWHRICLCHVNVLRPYCDRQNMLLNAESSQEAGETAVPTVVLFGAVIIRLQLSMVTGKASGALPCEVR